MGLENVFSIEEAAKRKHGSIHHLRSIMPSLAIDELVAITLPVGQNEERIEVLVQVINKGNSSFRVLYSDEDMETHDAIFLGDEFDSAYQARPVGSAQQYIIDHQELADEIIVKGAAGHGKLVIARAIHGVLTLKLSVPDAIEEALSLSRRCVAFERRIAHQIENMRMGKLPNQN